MGVVCCGPKKPGEGKGIHMGALVLYILAAILAVAGLALALSVYIALVDSSSKACEIGCSGLKDRGSIYDDCYNTCYNNSLGLWTVLIWPSIILAAFSAAMDIWGSVTACKAMNAIQAEMDGGPKMTGVEEVATTVNKA